MSENPYESMPLEELMAQAETQNTDPAFISVLMSQVMQLEVKLQDQAQHIETLQKDVMSDSLTGIANRRMFEVELNRSLSAAGRYGRQGALLMLDLDGFKAVNDSLGHLVGDQLLVHVAKLLKQNTRPTDLVARLGGDEFAIILNDLRGEGDASGCTSVLSQIVESTPCMLQGGSSVYAGISIGYYAFQAGDKMKDVIRKADENMYESKNSKS